MLVNTQYFRESALYYNKYGRYPDGNFGTLEYERFWEQEIERCRNGYKVGDTWVSGYHYFYLNYYRIIAVEKVVGKLYGEVTKDRQRGERVERFPDFWDVDFEFFQEVEKAETNGEHMVWLKPRGVGASFKGASMALRNFKLFKQSKSYMFAQEKEFLQRDAILTKWNDAREWMLRMHPLEDKRFTVGFAKPSEWKRSFEEMHYRASTKDPLDGKKEIGYKSEVIGVSLKDDIDKVRGKRGKLLLFEEMGNFSRVDEAWTIARKSVEEQDVTYGLMLGFGTGGTEGANFAPLEKMFYNPEAFNIRVFDNVWDDNAFGTKCAYFTPANRTIQFKDADGNSDIKAGDKYIDKERSNARKSPNSNDLLRTMAEMPRKPQEAILSTGYRRLPSALAKEWRIKMVAAGYHKLGMPGYLIPTDEGIKFRPDDTKIPITEFPIQKGKANVAGCVVVYHAPFKLNGKTPDNMYVISHDPYAQDATTGDSIGATHVYLNSNNIAPPGDKIVATYFGRPPKQDDYNQILFMLAMYYNAKIGFENDQGDVIGYAKRFKLLHLLQEEFECGWDETVKTKAGGKRSFGMNMGSGRENKRILQGDKYLEEWLLTPRGKTENGEQILNLHTIYCPFTLRQIEMYNGTDNYDAVASLRILMYFKREIDYKDIKVKKQEIVNPNSFFFKQLY